MNVPNYLDLGGVVHAPDLSGSAYNGGTRPWIVTMCGRVDPRMSALRGPDDERHAYGRTPGGRINHWDVLAPTLEPVITCVQCLGAGP